MVLVWKGLSLLFLAAWLVECFGVSFVLCSLLLCGLALGLVLGLAWEFEVGHRRLVIFDLASLVLAALLAFAIQSHLLFLSLAIGMVFALRTLTMAL